MKLLSRRKFLSQVATTYGIAGLGFVAMQTGLVASPAEAGVRGQDNLPPDLGVGQKVAVLGAGVAGLRAAWELAAGGFEVTVLEAAPYMGGRSQTIRPSSSNYKENWLAWPNQKNFPKSAYHDTPYQEVRDSDGNVDETVEYKCAFQDDAWENGIVGGDPVELYLNAGPGRIPSFHNAVLDHCRKFDVTLEPFTFTSRNNLMQRDDFNEGEPARLGLIKHSLRQRIEDILETLDQEALDGFVNQDDFKAFQEMIAAFGGSDAQRLGFEDASTPGAWFNNGTLNPAFSMENILDGKAWSTGLFNDMRVYWQTAMMQPTGGMDRVWANVLTKPLPDGSTIEDLVAIDAPVTKLVKKDGKLEITWGKDGQGTTETFDYCVSTMNAKQLSYVVEGFGSQLPNFLSQVTYTPACKVGWQSQGRWFEDDYEIYGGISWIGDTESADDTLISQMWYPSQNFHSRTATLTGAYTSGQPAEWFGALDHEERKARAVKGGAKLHGVSEEVFKNKYIHYDRGLSVSWQNAPYQDGGWTAHTFEDRSQLAVEDGNVLAEPLWDKLVSQPMEPLYLAGDGFSHTPGWKEGAIRSAMAAVYSIANQCDPTRAYNEGAGGTCRYERIFDEQQ